MTQILDHIRLVESIFQAFEEQFPDSVLDVRYMPDDEAIIIVPSDILHAAAKVLMETFDFYHLSTITGLDTGKELELLYHFWQRYGVTLCVFLPYDAAQLPSLTQMIPGAAFYEREIAEMLGVTFEGLHIPGPFLLPDDWEGALPFRRTLPG